MLLGTSSSIKFDLISACIVPFFLVLSCGNTELRGKSALMLQIITKKLYSGRFFKKRFYLFLERGGRREKEKLISMCPKPATQACAQTRNRTSDLLLDGTMSNQLSHTCWAVLKGFSCGLNLLPVPGILLAFHPSNMLHVSRPRSLKNPSWMLPSTFEEDLPFSPKWLGNPHPQIY